MNIHIYRFLSCYFELASALVGVVTLGIYKPYWDFNFMYWHAELELKRRAERKQIETKEC